MKNSLLTSVKLFFADRAMMGFVALLFLMAMGYVVYVALALQPSDLQVATRYTAFGETHFYRSKWYYLLSFVLFGLVTAGVHIALAVKLYNRGQRPLAVSLIALTLLILVIGWIIARSVLGIAFL
jgi:hypothetical protein